MILDQLSRNWWAIALRGLFAICFGALAFIWPGLTLTMLVLFFGAYALVNGLFTVVAAFNAPKGYPRFGALLMSGLVGILIGVLTFFWPGVTTLTLLYLIGAYAILTGLLEIFVAISLRKELTGEWALILSGALSVLFGLILFVRPGAGALAIAWWIGAYAVFFGVLLIILAFRLRGRAGRIAPA
jgi:uncharacterized membrane protein HdeD (DUF308 family)